jgi:hypothetical protein
MANYPKQLQLYPTHSYAGAPGNRIRDKAPGDRIIISDGFTPPSDLTVNDIIYDISVNLYGIDITGITHGKRTRPRDRLFKDDFGDIVVFPSGTPISGPKTANELIEILRVLWDIEHTVAPNRIGKATSVLK